uniref:Putative ovule protein n=1 Tax=Solanum chacoense TaxID=4108 RepID=A0A0V0HAE7_SOLCH
MLMLKLLNLLLLFSLSFFCCCWLLQDCFRGPIYIWASRTFWAATSAMTQLVDPKEVFTLKEKTKLLVWVKG